MGACAGRNKQNKNKHYRIHQNSNLPFDGSNYRKKRTFSGKKFEVGPANKYISVFRIAWLTYFLGY